MSERVQEVEAAVVGEPAGLSVSFTPASIEANFDALAARVDELAAPYLTARYDLSGADGVRQAKRDRAYLNGVRREIDERRKAVKREYEAPLKAFEARVREVTAKVDAASDAVKAQLDAAEEDRRARLDEALRGHYEGYAGTLASLAPWERVRDPRWLNASFGERKAQLEVEGAVDRLASDWEALRAREGEPHYDEAERAFVRTLSLGEAMRAQADAVEQERRIAAAKAEQDAARAAMGASLAPDEPEPAEEPPTPAEAPAARAPEGAAYVMVIDSATPAQLKAIADSCRMLGVSGRLVRGTLSEVWLREVANA